MDAPSSVPPAAARVVRVAAWLVPAPQRADWIARMARRTGRLGRRWSGRGHSPRPRRDRRRVLDPPAAARRSPLGRRRAPRLAPAARPQRIRRHRHRHPGARHGWIDRGLQRRLADPAAAVAVSRSGAGRDAVGAPALDPRPARRRARQLPRLARPGHVVHDAGRRRAVQPRLHRRRAARGVAHAQRDRGVLRELRSAAAPRAHVRARTSTAAAATASWSSAPACGDRASPPTRRRSGGA